VEPGKDWIEYAELKKEHLPNIFKTNAFHIENISKYKYMNIMKMSAHKEQKIRQNKHEQILKNLQINNREKLLAYLHQQVS
jgi:uncharacterized membrane protein